MLTVPFGFQERQQSTTYVCSVLPTSSWFPPGSLIRTERKPKGKSKKITLLILLSSMSFCWKPPSFGLVSRIAGAEAWQYTGRLTFTQSFHTRSLDSKAGKVLNLLLNMTLLLGYNVVSPQKKMTIGNQITENWGLNKATCLYQPLKKSLIWRYISQVLNYTKLIMLSPCHKKPIKLHYTWATLPTQKQYMARSVECT